MVDHGQHLARLHIQNHHRTCLGAKLLHALAQFAVGQVLQTQVDGQAQIIARACVGDHLHILDQATTAILQDLAAAGHALQPLVIGQLEPFLSLLIDVGKADQMGSHLTSRIEAAVLFDAVNAVYIQRHHRLAIRRRHAATQVDELLVGVCLEAFAEGRQVSAQRSGKRRPMRLLIDQLRGVGPNSKYRGADRQRLAVAVGNLATMGRDRHMAHATFVALAFQEALVQHVQLGNPPAHGHAAQAEHAHHQAETPGVEAAIGLECELFHGCTRITSLGSGTFMPSCSVAMRSIRL